MRVLTSCKFAAKLGVRAPATECTFTYWNIHKFNPTLGSNGSNSTKGIGVGNK